MIDAVGNVIYDTSQPSNKELSPTSYPMPFSKIRYDDHRREKNSSLNHFSMRKSISSHLILETKTDADIHFSQQSNNQCIQFSKQEKSVLRTVTNQMRHENFSYHLVEDRTSSSIIVSS
jgi:hypothetical protein